ncbi:MAG: site-specific integrase [Alphaproteobacteria bacterium]
MGQACAFERRFFLRDLRHWFAVDYLRRGGSIYDLKGILGHSSIKTTEIYLHFLTAGQQEKAKRAGAKTGTGEVVRD